MHRTSGTMVGLALGLALALGGSVTAQQQQHQQHHPGGTPAPQAQPAETGTTRQPQTMEQTQGMMEGMQGMMEGMQGMMEGMQGMMENMQSMMSQGGMMGRSGMMGSRGQGMMGPRGRGVMAEDEDDEEESRPHGMMQGMMGMGRMMGRHMERLTQQLELTDDQQAQVRTLMRNHAKDAIRLRADIGVMAIDVRQLLDAASVDLPKAKQLLQSMATKEADLRFSHVTLMQETNKLLTPEQQKKFRVIRSRMMMDSGGMMGHGGMMGREPRQQ